MSVSDVMDSVARTTESTFDRIDRDAVTAALPDFAGIAAAASPVVHAISGEVAHAASRAWRTRTLRTRTWILIAGGALVVLIGIGVLRRRRRSTGEFDTLSDTLSGTLPENRAETVHPVPSHRHQGAAAPV